MGVSNMANEDVKTREDLAAEAFGTTLEDIRKVRDRAIIAAVAAEREVADVIRARGKS